MARPLESLCCETQRRYATSGPPRRSGSDLHLNRPDATFRWDAANAQWVYNQSTENLISGVTYTYRVPLEDGTSTTYQFGVR